MIKKLIYTIPFLFWSVGSFAGNSPCLPTALGGMTDLEIFTTAGNTGSPVADPPCGNYNGIDFWFEVTVGPSGDLFIVSEADVLFNGAMAIYEGPCTNPELLRCVENDICGNTEMPITSFQNLTSGSTILIRFWAEQGSPNGNFLFYAGETTLDAPKFTLSGNAIYLDEECIRLTPDQQGQIGCAWLPQEVDFSMPLVHEMTVQFGSNTTDGADGICLTYQNNGTATCGTPGQGIASAGIPNSFIIEFDTWRNGGLSDPVADHIAVNLNGDMNHANSIAGPVTVGELEDGLEHTVEFRWDPTTMEYTILLDGAIIIQSNFDIVGNVFGGDPLVYWGYTSSTGGSTNEHIMCPKVANYPHGVIDTVEVEICEGEFHFAGGGVQSTSGTYVDVFPSFSGCDSIVITLLEVTEIPESTLDTILCLGECITVGGQLFCSTTNESVTIMSPSLPCDSIVHLTISMLDPIAVITSLNNTLNCDVLETELHSNQSSGDDDLVFSWTGPNNFTSDLASIIVDAAGTYSLTVEVREGDVSCLSLPATYEVIQDTLPPMADAGLDIGVPCSQIDTFVNGANSSGSGSISYEWQYQGGFYSAGVAPDVFNVGTYILTVKNNANGCIDIDTTEVLYNGEVPQVDAIGGAINCIDTSQILTFDSLYQNGIYTWTGPASFNTNELNPTVEVGGIYQLEIDLFNGSCIITDTAEVFIDTTTASFNIFEDTLTCTKLDVNLSISPFDPVWEIVWTDDDTFNSQNPQPTISNPGLYHVTVTTLNGCTNSDHVNIIQLLDTLPLAMLLDTLNCTKVDTRLNTEPSALNWSYNWTGPNSFMSQDAMPLINQPGSYEVTVTTSPICSSRSTVEVILIRDTIPIAVQNDTLTCYKGIIDLQTIPSNANWTYEWSGPNSFLSTDIMPMINEAGLYKVTITSSIHCQSRTTTNISLDIDTLDISISNVDTLDCLNTPYNIQLESDSGSEVLWINPSGDTTKSTMTTIQFPGEYQLQVVNDNGCLSELNFVVPQHEDAPQVELSTDTLTCLSTTVNVGASFNSTYDYSWTGPSNFLSDESTFNTSLGGNYFLTVTADNGCVTFASLNVDSDTIHPTTQLTDVLLNCSDTPTYFIEPILSGVTYLWAGPNAFSSQLANIPVSNPGQYFLTITDPQNGCFFETSLNANSPQSPQIINYNLEKANCIVNGAVNSIEVMGGVMPYRYSLNNMNITLENQFTDLPPDSYSLSITDSLNCTSTINFVIPNFTPISVDGISPLIELSEGDSIVLSPIYLPNIGLIDSINWSPSNEFSCSNCLYPILHPLTSNSYQLFLRDTNFCIVEIPFKINLKIDQFYIPNSFSPNGDGLNDVFRIFTANETTATIEEISIFNRWGDRVFYRTDRSIHDLNHTWDGTFNGQLLEPDGFAYVVKIRRASGASEVRKGEVYIVR